MPECSVVRRSWAELTTAELYSFVKLRTDVFFIEQKIDEEELDYRDLEPTTIHYWIADDAGRAVAYLRVIEDAEASQQDARRLIGRVVVRADFRGKGLAQQLIAAVLDEFGHEALLLHAQTYIAPLYAKAGFVAFGDEYVEAGIPHISMYRAAS